MVKSSKMSTSYNACVCVCIYVCVSVYISVCVCMSVCVSICVCLCVCMSALFTHPPPCIPAKHTKNPCTEFTITECPSPDHSELAPSHNPKLTIPQQ